MLKLFWYKSNKLSFKAYITSRNKITTTKLAAGDDRPPVFVVFFLDKFLSIVSNMNKLQTRALP